MSKYLQKIITVGMMLTMSVSIVSVNAQAKELKEEKPTWSVNSPQGVFKNASIDVTSGTWMNVDVSPDGTTLLFDLLGDIYTMPITGGEATPLMTDIAWQMQPKFSPDGKYIAFTSDEDGGDNLWIMNRDGSNRKAVSTEPFRLLNSPAWSPDGNYLIGRKHYSSTRSLGAGEVWLYHKTGGSGVMLTKRPNEQKDLGEPAYSADGKYVYFSQDATPGKTFHYSKDSVKGIYKIKRLELATGEIDTIISGKGGAIRPTPSPDGKYLAFISRDDFSSNLYLYDLTSGKETKIYENLERDLQETWAIHGVYPNIAWTPKSDSLVFWNGGKINRLDIASKKSSIIDFHVKTVKRIQQALRFKQDLPQDKFNVKMLRDVEISPDGNKVVFESMGHIYTRNIKNGKAQGKAKRLTKQQSHYELNPSFSRDGKNIVYATWNDDKQGQIRIVSSRGGKGKALLNEPGKYIEPTFSPDGKTVVYRKISGGYITQPTWDLNTGIYAISAKGERQGRKPIFITKDGRQPHFGSSSDNIYVMRNGDKPQLAYVSLDGKEDRVLYQGEFATEYNVSPNGKYLAFAERFKVFVTPFVERGDVITIGPKGGNFPVKQLSMRAGEGINWNSDSNELYWSLGANLFQANITDIFAITDAVDKKENIDNTSKEASATEVTKTYLGYTSAVDKPSGIIAFVGGKVVTMEGDKVIDNGTVLVEGNIIKAIGSKLDVTIPSSAIVIDITGKSIMPGLIDAHAHGPQGNNQIIPQQNWKNYAGLALGVTSIHDPSNDTNEFFAASEMQKAGKIVAARLFSTGKILYGANAAGYTAHVDSLADAKFHVERLKEAGAFSVKSYNQPRRNQRQQFIQAARELNMLVVPEGGSLLQHNLTMLVDGHTTLEHSIPVANIYDDVKQLWSQSEMAYTPTLVVAYGGIWGENYWYDKTDVWLHPRLSKYVPSEFLQPRAMRRPKAPLHHYNHFSVAKVAKELQDLGIKVNSGGHGQREGLAMHWEMWMMAQGGMTPLQALKTATIASAQTLGLDEQLGSIKTGKLADLIVVDGDVSQDIRQSDKVIYTMINGRLYNAETMDEVGHYDNKRAKFYFEN
ncbi:amidohydrolase family protein [Colwellia sp. 1_MG-2023]|uniref:amidohydrolase family protein n=1 Tax=unclassified Colwellia TaxID=196834 RepID=UPI0020917F6F|nr:MULTISPECIES: amidohydrolase family protein [unclassified Colwellia]MDO6651603.1 amidohydrolase family protein [Colwellia sp. 3_MG-2023]MDO6664999.1 amidohydrolase family protein [Colwellia sp. 2_MG-2023]MDO6689372.1 amidohydrolase family protein [Colwellia sp. 1_MG-2023]